MGETGRLSDETLVAALAALGRELAYPATPALVPAVTARIGTDRAARARPLFPRTALWSRRRTLVLVAIGVVALLGLAAAARLAIGAFEIRVQPGVTPSVSLPPVDPDEIGEATTLQEAQQAAGFAIALPDGPPPDEVYVVDSPFGDPGIVVAWQPSAPYPTIGGTKWSLVLMAFQGDAELVVKTVDRFEDVHEASVGGQPAIWIPVPHVVSLETEAGTLTYTVLGNVLIWETAEGIAYRLETSLGRAAAIEVAESVA